jgi:hypothetical protein
MSLTELRAELETLLLRVSEIKAIINEQASSLK